MFCSPKNGLGIIYSASVGICGPYNCYKWLESVFCFLKYVHPQGISTIIVRHVAVCNKCTRSPLFITAGMIWPVTPIVALTLGIGITKLRTTNHCNDEVTNWLKVFDYVIDLGYGNIGLAKFIFSHHAFFYGKFQPAGFFGFWLIADNNFPLWHMTVTFTFGTGTKSFAQ